MNNKKIIIIGGGHGTSIVLSSLADSGFDLTAILSMADDGGSTGRLRSELGVSAVGDIRQCLVTLSTKPEVAELFSYRFNAGELNGHSLGNLFLSAGELKTGSIEKSVEIAKKALGISANILPSTEDKPDLLLNLENKTVKGVYSIANIDFEGSKPDLSLEPAAKLSEPAKRAIEEADLIIVAPGNFYCSIMPALLVEGMAGSVNGSKAKIISICNLVNRDGHTAGFNVNDYVGEINRLTGSLRIDAVIYNTAPINSECLREGENQVMADDAQVKYYALGRDLADDKQAPVNKEDQIASVRSLVRHDKQKLKAAILEALGDFE